MKPRLTTPTVLGAKNPRKDTMNARKKGSAGLKLLPTAVLMALCSPALRAQSVTTVMTYDAGDHVASVTDPRGLVTTYTHDGLGHLLQQVSPDTGTVNYAYDGYGRPSSMTRADGVQTTYGYDSINRRTTVSAGGLTQTYAYDNCTNGLGRLCSDSDSTGATSYSYTPEGWMGGRGFTMGSTTYALGFSYDAMGRVTVVNYPDSNQAIYAYTNGAVSGISLKIGSASPINGATAITYRPMDMAMSAWTSSNGLTNTLSYDTDGRLTSISVPGKQSLGFTYDAADRITQITNGIDNTLTQNFGYDYVSRVTSVYSSVENESYQYDANGNRNTGTVNGVTQTYTYSPISNQLTGISGGASTQYGYDANGNTTLVNGAASYQYDPYTRLDAAGGAADYVNPEGQRLRKAGGSTGTTYFAPGTDGTLLAEDDNGTWVDYVRLNGRLIGRISTGQVSAIHDDQVGRPEVVTDASQNVIWLAQNFPFTQKVTTANITLNLGFPGQYYDTERQTWNNGYRDYVSNEGRYLESDPSGLAGGINTYVYVGSNPVSYKDALGLEGIGSWTFAPGPQRDEYSAFENGGLSYGNGSGSYMSNGTKIGAVAGTAIGVIIVNVAGFPEAEIAEGAIGVMGVEGFDTIMGLDAIAGEPVASYVVGGFMGIGPGFILGGGIGKGFDWLTGKYDKKNCQ
ncbi:RHS repeat-associated protein [Rhodanobacter sp. ANJX3]|uniref:RHS repeat protein n=1 Tax=Rhodanobacter sp. ANJX3 TaxID=2723083 RepID=UPI0016198AE6|nr:RHS repeat protein [Rhodanobacter sp. ANJX3]MBB5360410.1 RHS repeat-associated protein [Rhodanobacter sp. ANJX3]